MARLARLLAGGIVVAALAALGSDAQAQTAVGTALTYQAELRASGQPAAGPVDLRFRLYNAVTVGATVGPQIDRLNVVLAQGRFTQDLDFGVAAFGPDSRYLEIEVRNPAGAGAYVTLSPRQRVSAAPVAQFALDAASAATAVNATSAANATQFNGQGPAFYQNAANLSSGTIPSARLGGVYSGVLSLNNAGNTFTGGGAGLTGVNADLLDGLNSTAFLQSIPVPLNLSGDNTANIISATNSSEFPLSAAVEGASTAATGNSRAVYGHNSSDQGYGVYGGATSATGHTTGVFGGSMSPDGIGVQGNAFASTGLGYGVMGLSSSNNGIGVYGQGFYGGRFQTTSTSGSAVSGVVNIGTGVNYGGRFESASTAGRGVMGYAIANSGTTYGGYFQTQSSEGRAVFGWATAGNGLAFGGSFLSESTGGRGVYGSATAATGQTTGVYGLTTSPDGRGVFGTANSGFGGTNGVRGESNSPDGRGVLGFASATNGTNYGVRGQSDSPSGYGVYSVGSLGASGAKSFRIDHPGDPANKYLLHYATESPEVINFYRGTVVLDGGGQAVVELPHYFARINRTPSYTLTAVGAPMPMLHVAAEIDEAALIAGERAEPSEAAPTCSFRIAGGAPGAKVSWRIEAVRNDLWIQRHGAPVEVDKNGLEQGTYQHPELYSQPEEKGMNWSARPTALEAPASRSDQP